MNQQVKSASDIDNSTIRVGTQVQRVRGGPIVTVTRIHRQGADGTIITTNPAPDPEYPHHFSGCARDFKVIR